MTDKDGDVSGSWLVDDEGDDHVMGAGAGEALSTDWSSRVCQSLNLSVVGPVPILNW